MNLDQTRLRVHFEQLGEDYDGRVTDNDGNPFTGICYEEGPNSGMLLSETEYANGLKHGIDRTWYHNGQLESEGALWRGLPHGDDRYWHLNGRLHTWIRWELRYALERMDWNENGVLVRHQNMSSEEGALLERSRRHFNAPPPSPLEDHGHWPRPPLAAT